MTDSHRHITYEINSLIRDEIKKNDFNLVFDVNKLSSLIGLDFWYDDALFYLAKIPLSKTSIPAYSFT